MTLTAFQQGQIDGAWVPEPWATRLVKEGGGKILVDEAEPVAEGRFVTTDLIVSTKFLTAHPDVVKQLIEGEVAAIDLTKTNRTKAEGYVVSGITKATGKAIAPDLVTASFDSITFTTDPIVTSLLKNAQESKALGFTDHGRRQGHLRPLDPQRGPEGQGPADDQHTGERLTDGRGGTAAPDLTHNRTDRLGSHMVNTPNATVAPPDQRLIGDDRPHASSNLPARETDPQPSPSPRSPRSSAPGRTPPRRSTGCR